MPSNVEQLRRDICEVGRRVWQRGYVAANDGNFSVRLDDGTVLATPTRVSKGFMSPDDLVILDLDGNQLGGRRKMTSEIRMHLAIYRHRDDITSVVHAHPPHATAFCVARATLPQCVLPEVEMFLGDIPMVPYATTGTQEFADALVPFLPKRWAWLLASHGVVTAGDDPFDAYHKMEGVEHYAHVLMLASQLGGWSGLNAAQVGDLFGIRKRLGFDDPRFERPANEWCTPAPAPAPDVPRDMKQELPGAFAGAAPGTPTSSRDAAPTSAPGLRTPSTSPLVDSTTNGAVPTLDRDALRRIIRDELLRRLG